MYLKTDASVTRSVRIPSLSSLPTRYGSYLHRLVACEQVAQLDYRNW